MCHWTRILAVCVRPLFILDEILGIEVERVISPKNGPKRTPQRREEKNAADGCPPTGRNGDANRGDQLGVLFRCL